MDPHNRESIYILSHCRLTLLLPPKRNPKSAHTLSPLIVFLQAWTHGNTRVQIHTDDWRSPDVFNRQRGPTLADKRLVTCL